MGVLIKLPNGNYFSRSLQREVEIENSIMKPLISGSNAKRYIYPITNKYLLHPYYTSDNFNLIPYQSLGENFPKAFSYLKANEKFLRAREKSKMNNDSWYGYNYPKNLNKQNIVKIGVAQTVTDLQCFMDEQGNFFINNVRVNGITPKNDKIMIKYLLGVLNSKIANFYFKLIAKPKNNGFYEANKQFIAPIPIIMASYDQQKNIINYVDKILQKKQSNPQTDTTEFEAQIDQLIYKLYNLTEEEINIIESYNEK